MDVLPSDIIFDIFSRIPAKDLAHLRCVSKRCCAFIDDRYLAILHRKRAVEEPIPIMFHVVYDHWKPPTTTPSYILCFHRIKVDSATRFLPCSPKKDPFLEFKLKEVVQFLGSCNGLLCFSEQVQGAIYARNLIVINPFRKECYKVPSLPPEVSSTRLYSYGLGFDESTNSFKMVCEIEIGSVMLHVIGTNLWRKINLNNQRHLISGRQGVFSHGCLHWLVSDKTKIIYFDVAKEKFGLMNYPEPSAAHMRRFGHQLVDLIGEVGLVFHNSVQSTEIWILNQQKEWVLHNQLENKLSLALGYNLNVLGLWNNDGDILFNSTIDGISILKCGRTDNIFFERGTYKLNGVAARGERIIMCQTSILSIQGNTNFKRSPSNTRDMGNTYWRFKPWSDRREVRHDQRKECSATILIIIFIISVFCLYGLYTYWVLSCE